MTHIQTCAVGWVLCADDDTPVHVCVDDVRQASFFCSVTWRKQQRPGIASNDNNAWPVLLSPCNTTHDSESVVRLHALPASHALPTVSTTNVSMRSVPMTLRAPLTELVQALLPMTAHNL